ncbi:hypothetical protein [Bordetella sp. H567]|uniref:hypothetical protein n=1 Tax=Bordetella sp. H567 TaxID=1697043 RepID=UPI0011AB6AD9|nr:hypothetical protein [Bordetella sp. H567]
MTDPAAWPMKVLPTAIAAVLVFIGSRLSYGSVPDRAGPPWTGMLAVGAVAVVQFAWAGIYDSVQNSDFGVYWTCGSRARWDFVTWIASCQSEYLRPSLTYWTRSLFYTGLLNGIGLSSYVDLKLANVLLHLVALTIWFVGVRRWYGERVATCTTILLAVFPEFWFTTTLASTDNAAVIFVVLFLLLLPRLLTGRLAFVAPALAATIFMGDALRSIGPLMLAATVFWVIAAADRKRLGRLVLGSSVVIFVYAALRTGMSHATQGTIAAEPLQLFKILSSIDFHTNQDFNSNYPWGQYFWYAVPLGDRLGVALLRFSQEMINGLSSFPQYLMSKAYTLFSATGYYGLSSLNYTGFNPDTVYVVSKSTVPFRGEWFSWLNIVGLTYVCLAIKGIAWFRADGLRLAALSWMAAFFLVVLCLGETQARYVLLIAPALCLLAAQGLLPVEADIEPRKAVVRLWPPAVLLFGLFTSLCLVFWAVRSTHPNLSVSTTLAGPTAAGRSCEGAQIVKAYNDITIRFPPGVNCALLAVPLGPDAKSLSFFVSATRFPYLWEPRQPTGLRYDVTVDGQLSFAGALADEPVRWQRVEIPPTETPAPEILIRLYRDQFARPQAFNVSWLHEK